MLAVLKFISYCLFITLVPNVTAISFLLSVVWIFLIGKTPHWSSMTCYFDYYIRLKLHKGLSSFYKTHWTFIQITVRRKSQIINQKLSKRLAVTYYMNNYELWFSRWRQQWLGNRNWTYVIYSIQVQSQVFVVLFEKAIILYIFRI